MRGRIKLRIVLFCMMILSSVCGFTQTSKYKRAAPQPPFMADAQSFEETSSTTKVVFKNGLTALVHEFRTQPLVSIRAAIRAGSLYEPADAPGLAVFASGALTGTGGASGTFRRKLQALGGIYALNADFDKVVFEIAAPSEQWKNALKLHSETMLDPFNDKPAVKRAAEMFARNVREASANPSDQAKEALLDLSFGSRKFIPSLPDGNSLSDDMLEKLIDFHKRRYVPSEITLIVSGDVRSMDVLNEVSRLYGSISRPAALPAVVTALSAQNTFRFQTKTGDNVFPRLLFGFRVPAENSKDYAALEVIRAILGVGESSRINARLRDQKELIFDAQTTLRAYTDSGLFSIALETEPQNIDKTEIALLTEIELLKRKGPSEFELERAFAQLEREWWTQVETAGRRGEILARLESYGDWKRMEKKAAEIRKVAAAEVREALNRYFNLSNCSLIEFLPQSLQDRQLSTEAVERTLSSLLKPAADEEQRLREQEIPQAFRVPEAGNPFKPNELRHPFQSTSILRGPEIYFREDHSSPLMEMGVMFPGGKSGETRTSAGITRFMLELMAYENLYDRFQLEIYGGKLTPVIADDYFGFYLSIPSRNAAAGFEILQKMIRSPDFTKTNIQNDGCGPSENADKASPPPAVKEFCNLFKRVKKLQSARLKARNTTEDHKRIVINALFKNHDYALDGFGTPASLDEISVETLRRTYDENVKNHKPTVVIIGDVEGTAPASWFVQRFSGSRMLDGNIASNAPEPLGEKTELEHNSAARDAMVLLGFQAPRAGDADVYVMRILQSFIEEALAQKIVNQRDAARRITLDYLPEMRGGGVLINAWTKAGEEAQTLTLIQEEIQRLKTSPFSSMDIRAAAAAAIGANRIRNQTRQAQIMGVAENAFSGGGLEDFVNFSGTLQETREEDIVDLMRRVFDMNKAVVLLVHGNK